MNVFVLDWEKSSVCFADMVVVSLVIDFLSVSYVEVPICSRGN